MGCFSSHGGGGANRCRGRGKTSDSGRARIRRQEPGAENASGRGPEAEKEYDLTHTRRFQPEGFKAVRVRGHSALPGACFGEFDQERRAEIGRDRQFVNLLDKPLAVRETVWLPSPLPTFLHDSHSDRHVWAIHDAAVSRTTDCYDRRRYRCALGARARAACAGRSGLRSWFTVERPARLWIAARSCRIAFRSTKRASLGPRLSRPSAVLGAELLRWRLVVA